MLKIVAISHSFRLGPKNFDQKFFQNGGSKINIQKYLNFSTAAIHWRGHKHMGELADAKAFSLSLSLSHTGQACLSVRAHSRAHVF